jgi:Trypsin
MRPLPLLAAAISACALFAAPADAIVGGSPDSSHPYVGLLDNGSTGCSGTLVSPRVVVTAAHCFSAGTSAFGTDRGQPRIRVSFDQQGLQNPNRASVFGAYFWDPSFCSPCGHGSKRIDDHDVAVVILDDPVAMASYGQLPTRNLDDSFRKGTALDAVGYGVQQFLAPGQPDPNAVWTRDAASVTLLDNDRGANGNFLKISQAQCLGDSGGPVLLAGTNVLVAEMSYGDTRLCDKPGFDYRLDGDALDFIAATVAANP